MNNTEKLIEKYKNDMLNISRRSVFKDEYKKPEEIKNEAETVQEEVITEMPEDKKDDNMHFGSLKVMAFAGNEAFPVETADVEVSDSEGNVLYSLLTDSGGIAEGMLLSAPSESENDSPGGKDGFSLYKIRVSHPDYETEIFENVQIFEGVESIQPVFFSIDDPRFNERGED